MNPLPKIPTTPSEYLKICDDRINGLENILTSLNSALPFCVCDFERNIIKNARTAIQNKWIEVLKNKQDCLVNNHNK